MNTFCIETRVSIDKHGQSCLQDSKISFPESWKHDWPNLSIETSVSMQKVFIISRQSMKKSDKVQGENSVQDKSRYMYFAWLGVKARSLARQLSDVNFFAAHLIQIFSFSEHWHSNC